jgi:hypothetical protein
MHVASQAVAGPSFLGPVRNTEKIMNMHCLFAMGPLRCAAAWTRCLPCIAVASVLVAPGVHAEPRAGVAPVAATTWGATALDHVTPAELQSAYLECDRMAMTTALDFGTAAGCSVVYEALKARMFGGDFERLLEWHRRQRAAQPVGATARQP